LRKNNKNRTFVFSIIAAMFVLGVIGAQLYSGKGWYWRIPPMPTEITAQLNDSAQFHQDQFGGRNYRIGRGWIHGEGVADLVLIGDSHAQHLTQGLKEVIGEGENKNIYMTSASCLMAPDFTRTTAGTDWGNICPSRLSEGIIALKKNPHAALMLSEFWLYQLMVAGLLNSDEKLVFDEERQETFDLLFEKLDKLKTLIGQRPLIIMGNVPGAGVSDLSGCYTRPTFIRSHCQGKLGITQKEAAFRLGNQWLHEYTQKRNGIYFFNPYDVFCDNGFCRSIENNLFYYSDGYHLSINGSVAALKHFRSSLLEIMERHNVMQDEADVDASGSAKAFASTDGRLAND
jgi:hypothetical protein